MANKVKYVRECFPIVKTAQGKGLEMTIRVTRYNDMINVNGNPIGRFPALGAASFLLQALEELEKRWKATNAAYKANENRS
jgi:hypothetical protein